MPDLDDVILSVDGAATVSALHSSDRSERHSENKHCKSCLLVVLQQVSLLRSIFLMLHTALLMNG